MSLNVWDYQQELPRFSRTASSRELPIFPCRDRSGEIWRNQGPKDQCWMAMLTVATVFFRSAGTASRFQHLSVWTKPVDQRVSTSLHFGICLSHRYARQVTSTQHPKLLGSYTLKSCIDFGPAFSMMREKRRDDAYVSSRSQLRMDLQTLIKLSYVQ